MARIEIHETTGGDDQGEGGGAACRWTLHLPKLEASVVDALPDKLEQLLGDPDNNRSVIDRLFPPSYTDPEEQRANRRLLGSSLLSERREMLKAVRMSMRAGRRRARIAGESSRGVALRLDTDSLDVWLRFINDMRLMLATELGVDQNLGDKQIMPGDPDAPQYTLLIYLGGLESLLVEAAIGDTGF